MTRQETLFDRFEGSRVGQGLIWLLAAVFLGLPVVIAGAFGIYLLIVVRFS